MKELTSMAKQFQDSYLSGENDAYLENLYETFLKNPSEISPDWQQYFKQMGASQAISHADVRQYFAELAKHPVRHSFSAAPDLQHIHQQEKIIELINAYRSLGHLQANIDPLGLRNGIDNPILELSYYGFTDADLKTTFDVGSFVGLKKKSATLKEIYDALRNAYCSTLAIEYTHIMQEQELTWLQQRIENDWLNFTPSKEEKLRLLDRLIAADGLEKYLGFKYVGQKRFSLEGGDSFIPMLDTIVTRGAELGVKEIILGMAHRGRLNVLVNVLGKEPATIFAGFEGKGIDESSSGDVKYHMGYSSDVQTPSGDIHLALTFNPSHLEIVSPVVQGSVRSRQRRRRDTEHQKVMPIQIHGDAAFSGQGVVMETFNMSQARWFTVGGSIHVVINNQVGFTISDPRDARSGTYCTDVAKMVQAPILHVNANDPEAVLFAAKLAIDYRNAFKKDIVIDLVCYRRHGHNEADEPSATQPIMYKIIKTLPAPCTLYAQKLVKEGLIDDKTEHQLAEDYRARLDTGKSLVTLAKKPSYEFVNSWEPFLNQQWTAKAKTAVPLKKIKALATAIEQLPKEFVFQPQVKKMLEAREKMTTGEVPINWGYAEIMAYATLLDEGYPIRLCGQDACRGTFAHRHAVLHDQNTDQVYIPLSHLKPDQVQINIIDSLLSEEAVMAFEYGFASAEPNNLVIWEAQFGDFANGAQVVIDQFISSGEQKWGRLCGLVLFLPHGYEGQGPEHSSARLERYLQLCAQQNMQVCVPSTPAQTFHMIRRQMIRPYRKPLIVMTPKSLLRHPLAVSSLDELTQGEFQLVIPEIDTIDTKKVDRVILCCGKVYYDLLEKRREQKLNNIAILRVEQLYPFPTEQLTGILAGYAHAKTIIWCQEEPMNQGAWYSTQHHLLACLAKEQKLFYAGRQASASPAVGYASVHAKEQAKLVNDALTQSFSTQK
ncbi:2-oxoglutarate dehydrogenase subunit E1 [Gammaproteobacteria bacterium SCGC AG-212-F23]|nr:2-oxoglutarate dehydrogenase subunit E1 [Gammaproteobacteria bacterium SCGC AG-212-F23]